MICGLKWGSCFFGFTFVSVFCVLMFVPRGSKLGLDDMVFLPVDGQRPQPMTAGHAEGAEFDLSRWVVS